MEEINALSGWISSAAYTFAYHSASRSDWANEMRKMPSYRYITRFLSDFLLILTKAIFPRLARAAMLS
jgi:hypothetical protein